MKKIIFVIAALALLVSCNKEQPINIDNNGFTPEPGTVISFSASLPVFDGETKAFADGSFVWKDGDKIAVPVSDGYVDFTYSGTGNDFTFTASGETFVNGTAFYPSSTKPEGDYSTTFTTIDAARAGFKMTAPYTAGATSLTFTHQSSIVKLSFTNVPNFANKVIVNDGAKDVATINLDSVSSSMDVWVPLTPDGSKTYTFKLQENNNVLKKVSKTIELTSGKWYPTPAIAVSYIVVGVIDYIYNGWGLTSGWKLHHWGSSLGDKDLDLKYSGTTTTQSVGGSYWSGVAQTFYVFYTVDVPADMTGFCVFWTNNEKTDWYNNGGSENGGSANTGAYVFEYGDVKHTFYN